MGHTICPVLELYPLNNKSKKEIREFYSNLNESERIDFGDCSVYWL